MRNIGKRVLKMCQTREHLIGFVKEFYWLTQRQILKSIFAFPMVLMVKKRRQGLERQ